MSMGCCCGVSCTIATNDFGTDLSNMTGTGSISGGLLILDAGEIEIFNTSAATDDDGQHLVTFADTASSPATVRLIVAYTDASNYLFGEFAIAGGAGTIRLGQRVGGSDEYLSDADTITDTSTDLTDRHELALCWRPGEEVESESRSTNGDLPTEIVSATGWTDPENVLANDSGVALWLMSGPAPSTTDSLTVQWDNLPQIPIGSTIDGIKVVVEAGHDGSSSDVTASVELSIGASSDVKGPTAISSGSAAYEFGSAVDPWSVNATPQSINTGPVGASLSFTDNDTAAAQVSVQAIWIIIYYSTPDHRPGRLDFSIKNNGSGLYQCVTNRRVFASGLQAGLRAQTATWDFTEATYSYHQSATRPSCPTCNCPANEDGEPCACCTEPEPLAEYVVDLGVGGWTDDECGGCDDVEGPYTVASNGSCQWVYEEDFTCTCDTRNITTLAISLYLVDDDGCRWRAVVNFFGDGTIDPTDDCTPSGVFYESAALASPTDCQDMPVTLTKVLELSDSGGTDMCDGSMPATITLDAP